MAAFISPIIGLVCGLVVWATTAYHYYNEVTVASLGGQLPCMFGGLTALFLPGIVSIIVSLTIRPYNFDWKELRRAELIVSAEDRIANHRIEVGSEKLNEDKEGIEKQNQITNVRNRDTETDSDNIVFTEVLEVEEQKRRLLSTYLKLAYGAFIFTLLITWVIWPLPLYRDWTWSRAYFKGYITVSLIWVYGALLVIGVYPLIDGRHSAAKIARGMYNDYLKRN